MSDFPYKSSKYRYTAIRFIKSKKGIFGIPKINISADFECEITKENGLYYETDGEIVIYIKHFILKDACLISIDVEDSEEYEIKHILCEGKYMAFNHSNNKYIFQIEISGLLGPTRTLYAHSILREDGITLRVEENDIGRCAGKYEKDTYPQTQIDASVHYTFAAREVLRHMGIGKYLHDNNLGYILLLGFETCNELHPDYPPHWHLIFRWPYFCGSQAPHIYIDKEGKMESNVTYIDGISGVCRKYQTLEWCKMVDMYGADVMAFRLMEDGGMELTSPGGNTYKIAHYSREDGVKVYCDDRYIGNITVKNDTDNGQIKLLWNNSDCIHDSYTEIIEYDQYTGNIKKVECVDSI